MVEVTVDSLSVDPRVEIRYETPTLEQITSDDDSGGGIFGQSAHLIYKAPKDGSYQLRVSGYDYDGTVGGYFVHVASAPVDAEPAKPSVDRTFFSTGYGRMA